MGLTVKKDNRIEIIRIIAIILVIYGHIANRFLDNYENIEGAEAAISIFINNFARISVPLFFMISGIVNIPKEFDKRKYFSRIIRLLIILAIWTLIYFFIYESDYLVLAKSLFSEIKNHLWYMYALIGLSIASPFISKLVMNLDEYQEKLFAILWFTLCGGYHFLKVISKLFGVDTSTSHNIPIFNATYYLGYYVVGYLVYKNLDKILKAIDIRVLLTIAVSCLVFNGFVTSAYSYYLRVYYKGLYAFSDIFVMLPAVIFLIIFLKIIKDKDYKIIKLVCPYIFGIYLSHIIILDFLMEKLKLSNVFLGCFVYSVLTTIGSYLLIFIIKKIPFINKYIC